MLQSFGVIVKQKTKMEIIEKKARIHFEFEDIETFLRLNVCPKTGKEWGVKFNFKRACKNFPIGNGQFSCKRQLVLFMAKQKQLEIIKDVHGGVG